MDNSLYETQQIVLETFTTSITELTKMLELIGKSLEESEDIADIAKKEKLQVLYNMTSEQCKNLIATSQAILEQQRVKPNFSVVTN